MLPAVAAVALACHCFGQAQAATPAAGNVFAVPPAASAHGLADSTFDCPDVFGRVFDDSNANGYPDPGERGIADARLATVRGLLVRTDAEGRFHIPCPETPKTDRGANFAMKLDVRSLPAGYRMTTPNPRAIRLTGGRTGEIDFGATYFRTVRVAMEDAAFESGSVDLQPQWQQQIDALPRTLMARPSIVSIVYKPGADAADLVDRRIAALRGILERHWKELQGRYVLTVQAE